MHRETRNNWFSVATGPGAYDAKSGTRRLLIISANPVAQDKN
jgi:hypothetical protein